MANKKKEPIIGSPLMDHLKATENNHYNFDEEIIYQTSSGSLLFDIELGGGFYPGIIRPVGVSRGGKTSMLLQTMHEFLKTPNRRGIYVKAEGRLDQGMQARSGINFVINGEDWADGNCFIYKTNCFEDVIDLIRELIHRGKNVENKGYFFILDSMDNLVPRAYLDKPLGDKQKIGSGASLSAEFMAKFSLGLRERGHYCGMIGQVRAKPKIDMKTKMDPQLSNASGGNALQHGADYLLQFEKRWAEDIIWEGKARQSAQIGHFVRVSIAKGIEKDGVIMRYPVKYGNPAGKSVWRSMEVKDLMLNWGLIKASGAWFSYKLDEDTLRELKKKKIEVPSQIQGEANLLADLESREDFLSFMENRFLEMLKNK